MKKLITCTALAAVMLSHPLHAQTPSQPPRFITVSGEGEVEAAPDKVRLHFAVVSEHKDLPQAKAANDVKTNKVQVTAKEMKIPADKLELSGMYVQPQYQYTQDGKRNFQNYRVNRSITISLDGLETYEPLVAKLVEAGVDQVDNVTFSVAKPQELEAKARAMAAQNARERAEAIVSSLGAKLGRVQSIVEGGGGYMPQPPMPMMKMARMEQQDGASAPEPMAGKQTIRQTLTVTFELQ